MKKILLTMAVVATAMFATAQTKTYTDELIVSVNGNAAPAQQTTINVEKMNDGTYTLSLLNFILVSVEDGERSEIPVGNIVVSGITATEKHGIRNFATKQVIPLTEGDPALASFWLASMLGEIPVDINGEMTDGSLYCTIDIDLNEVMGQVINVKFGKDITVARNYEDDLVVTINGNASAPQRTVINVDDKADNTYTLSLNNFILRSEDAEIPVGNIVVHGITVELTGNYFSFATKQEIEIVEGSIEAPFWLGPQLGKVPVEITGKLTGNKLYCNIDIDLSETMGQIINVKFGHESLTGIENIVAGEESNVIYDLTGRRVNAVTVPGIYIVNGKKQIVK